VGLERGALGLVSTIEELLEKKNSALLVGNREYGCRGSVALTTLQTQSAKVDTNNLLCSEYWGYFPGDKEAGA
jgi:hypothetical protein